MPGGRDRQTDGEREREETKKPTPVKTPVGRDRQTDGEREREETKKHTPVKTPGGRDRQREGEKEREERKQRSRHSVIISLALDIKLCLYASTHGEQFQYKLKDNSMFLTYRT